MKDKGKIIVKDLCHEDLVAELVAILTTNGYDVKVKATENYYEIKYKPHKDDFEFAY